jgi:hypothetical protein
MALTKEPQNSRASKDRCLESDDGGGGDGIQLQ